MRVSGCLKLQIQNLPPGDTKICSLTLLEVPMSNKTTKCPDMVPTAPSPTCLHHTCFSKWALSLKHTHTLTQNYF